MIEPQPASPPPKPVATAVRLLYAGIVLSIPAMLIVHFAGKPGESLFQTVLHLLLSVVLMGSATYSMSQGRVALRFWLAALVAFTAVIVGLLMPALLALSLTGAILMGVQLILEVSGIILLYTPTARAWFRAQPAQPD